MAHSLETMRELADLAEQVARLPDAVNVSAETAALLISVDDPPGPRTMEGWGDEAQALRRAAGEEKHTFGNVGNTYFVLREDGFIDMQAIQLAELKDVPRGALLRVTRLTD